jgi:hypothetical protein
MASVIHMPGAATPAQRILSGFTRGQLAGFIEVAIGLLDLAEGDPDIELNGDESDGSLGEDDFCSHNLGFAGPGCPVSDPDLAVDDDACDADQEDGL